MSVSPTADPSLYRPCVGMVIFNPRGHVWLGRRAGETGGNIWQYPQGGIDPGETAEYAAIREVHEETGISVQDLRPMATLENELFYDLPVQYKRTRRTKKWRGQRQIWFAARFIGDDASIDLTTHGPPEFSTWRWGDIHEAVETVVPFKRDVYARLAQEFGSLAKPTP